MFQPPVFAEPRFQTPERAAAEAAAGLAEAAEPEEETEELPEEQPAASRRRRRRKGASEEPEAAAPAAAEEAPEADAEEEPDQAEDRSDNDEGDDHDDHESSGSRRRRRRGGRRRRRGDSADADSGEQQDGDTEDTERAGTGQSAQDAEDTDAQSDEDAEERDEREDNGGSSSSRRRRRRRRRAGDSGGEPEPSADDPERTVVKVREPRPKAEPSDEVQSIKGSTRLEAKKQRRREGREQGRRRVPIITEAEFLARREAVERVMVVRQHGDRTQIGVLEDGVLVEHYVNKEQATSYVGNVYLGKVQNVLPSMEAAFIDIGKGRNAVLYAGEVNFDALGMSGGPRRIESALKSGQPVLVQVTKDPIGHKGARLTSQVSLPGRYLVYVPEGSMTGISRKLPDTERARLKTILKKIVPEDAGVIVRTAAEGASEDELRRDVERLQAQWEEIKKKSKNGGTAPTLLYGEPDMTVRVVRDIFNEDFSKVIVSGDEAWETIHGYVSHVAPDLAERLQRWTSEVDVFATYRIDEQLAKALDRKVWLPSGGSLVIDRTEAMVVIDVNTGKFTGQGGNLEETVTRNNLEAAEEIVRQLRLRDLGGIIVIDFIDMVLESNRDLVLRRLLECLGRDRTKHQVAEVTSLGLVQMTRKRVGQGLLESFSETCVHCNGRGVIVHLDQPSSSGGGKRRKRARAGAADQPHEHEAAVETPEQEAEAESETPAEVAAEVAEPAALPAPEFTPDEELYSSAAEAEAAASRGRTRRRASRRASAPAGSPQRESAKGGPQAGRGARRGGARRRGDAGRPHGAGRDGHRGGAASRAARVGRRGAGRAGRRRGRRGAAGRGGRSQGPYPPPRHPQGDRAGRFPGGRRGRGGDRRRVREGRAREGGGGAEGRGDPGRGRRPRGRRPRGVRPGPSAASRGAQAEHLDRVRGHRRRGPAVRPGGRAEARRGARRRAGGRSGRRARRGRRGRRGGRSGQEGRPQDGQEGHGEEGRHEEDDDGQEDGSQEDDDGGEEDHRQEVDGEEGHDEEDGRCRAAGALLRHGRGRRELTSVYAVWSCPLRGRATRFFSVPEGERPR
ncbi:ribonuclease E/G [Streptomyces lusitanus]|uniref:Rne/Rng family ribonuclease n=1 Tax=Streptomyces lusitanus TaxID=68232 RepID=UPI0036F422C1